MFAMVFLSGNYLRSLVWIIFLSGVTKPTYASLADVVKQTEELNFGYNPSVVENGRFCVYFCLFFTAGKVRKYYSIYLLCLFFRLKELTDYLYYCWFLIFNSGILHTWYYTAVTLEMALNFNPNAYGFR